MSKIVTTTADPQILEKFDKTGISRTRALELGMKWYTQEHEMASDKDPWQKIVQLNKALNDKCQELEKLKGRYKTATDKLISAGDDPWKPL